MRKFFLKIKNKVTALGLSAVYLAAEPTGIDSDKFQDVGKKFFQFTSGPGSTRTAGDLVLQIIAILLYFAAAVAVIFLVIGGFHYITARGNEEQTESAKKTITGAVIGIIVILMAFAIVSIVSNLLTGNAVPSPGAPAGGGQQQDQPDEQDEEEQDEEGQPQAIILVNTDKMVYLEGEQVQITFSAAPSGNYSWNIQASPSLGGVLNISQSPPSITGFAPPGAAGSYDITVTASQAGTQAASKTFNLRIVEEAQNQP